MIQPWKEHNCFLFIYLFIFLSWTFGHLCDIYATENNILGVISFQLKVKLILHGANLIVVR